MNPSQSSQTKIFTVSELNTAAQRVLEGHFSEITVEGEISNLSKPSSGHLYFSLKDPKAQIRCALFRGHAQKLKFDPRNGLLVQVKAKVSIYPDRGDYQLMVTGMELAGDGLLRQAYEELFRKLSAKGLFDAQFKQPLPSFPKHIGIVTSATGAALRDILNVLKRRFPIIPISIYPTKVQGSEAAPEIVLALELANRLNECDVIILARGGGSLEDLWPFNEEIVVNAIFASKIPIITGVGHEVDFTLADFVSDKRAPTPSVAAELATPNEQAKILQLFIQLQKRLTNETLKFLNYRNQRLDSVLRRLRHPRQTLVLLHQRSNHLHNRLMQVMMQLIKDKKQRLQSNARALDMVSPLSTLGRGYAIVRQESNASKAILRSVKEVKENDSLEIKLIDGNLLCAVSAVYSNAEAPKAGNALNAEPA